MEIFYLVGVLAIVLIIRYLALKGKLGKSLERTPEQIKEREEFKENLKVVKSAFTPSIIIRAIIMAIVMIWMFTSQSVIALIVGAIIGIHAIWRLLDN